jgi:hypothetical protein
MWLCAQGTQSFTYKLAQPDSVYGVRSTVIEDGATKSLIGKLEALPTNQSVKGHRVCIFMEKNQSARNDAFEAEATFKQNYPDIPTYVIYDRTSYWKVLVGNCLTIDEVTMLKAKAEKLFPSKPFIVQEDIQISEFGKPGEEIGSSQYLATREKNLTTPADTQDATPSADTAQPQNNNNDNGQWSF